MGRKTDIYASYLADWQAKHPHVEQPLQCLDQYAAGYEALRGMVQAATARGEAVTQLRTHAHCGKLGAWGTLWGFESGIVLWTGYRHIHGGASREWAVLWPSVEAFDTYAEPLSVNQYWNG